MTVEDVKHWIVFRGVSHAVGMERSGWCHTACNSLITGQSQPKSNRRICLKCRMRLKDAKPIKEVPTK